MTSNRTTINHVLKVKCCFDLCHNWLQMKLRNCPLKRAGLPWSHKCHCQCQVARRCFLQPEKGSDIGHQHFDRSGLNKCDYLSSIISWYQTLIHRVWSLCQNCDHDRFHWWLHGHYRHGIHLDRWSVSSLVRTADSDFSSCQSIHFLCCSCSSAR